MKKSIIAITLILILTISLYGCKSNSSNTDLITATEETPSETTSEDDILDETLTEKTTLEQIPIPVKENFMAGSLVFSGAEVYYSYTAQLSGIYRFDFDINSIENDYKFILMTEKDETLIETQYSYCNDGGVSYNLEENQTYYIKVIQVEGEPEYSVKIGIPEKTKQINGDTFSGNLSYIDKRDCFKFKPKIAGIYRFDFDTTNVNYNYKFELYGQKKELIKEADYNYIDNGVSVELEKDIDYTIYISQKEGTPEYEINIGIPKEKEAIKNGIFSGKIRYIDQCDLYSYPLSKGEYQVQFKNINSNSEIKLRILSSKQENIFEHSQSSDIITFDVEENDTYEIQIEQRNGYTDYEIIITKI